MKNALPGVCVTLCGMQDPIGEAEWGCGDQIGAQQAAKWGVQTGEMIFQTRSKELSQNDRDSSLWQNKKKLVGVDESKDQICFIKAERTGTFRRDIRPYAGKGI